MWATSEQLLTSAPDQPADSRGLWFVCFFFFFQCSRCDAKPKIQLLHRDQYVTRSWKSGVGHAGGDGQPEGRVISFVTGHCIVAEEHIESNTAELNRNETPTWQLPGMPSSTSLRMGLESRLQSKEDYKSLEEQKVHPFEIPQKNLKARTHWVHFSSLSGTKMMLYSKLHQASSSNLSPILCPPALKFFPSLRADRVSFTLGWRVCE